MHQFELTDPVCTSRSSVYTGIAFRPQDAYASNSINLERKQQKS